MTTGLTNKVVMNDAGTLSGFGAIQIGETGTPEVYQNSTTIAQYGFEWADNIITGETTEDITVSGTSLDYEMRRWKSEDGQPYVRVNVQSVSDQASLSVVATLSSGRTARFDLNVRKSD